MTQLSQVEAPGSGFALLKDEVEEFRRGAVAMGHVEGSFILRLCDAVLKPLIEGVDRNSVLEEAEIGRVAQALKDHWVDVISAQTMIGFTKEQRLIDAKDMVWDGYARAAIRALSTATTAVKEGGLEDGLP